MGSPSNLVPSRQASRGSALTGRAATYPFYRIVGTSGYGDAETCKQAPVEMDVCEDEGLGARGQQPHGAATFPRRRPSRRRLDARDLLEGLESGLRACPYSPTLHLPPAQQQSPDGMHHRSRSPRDSRAISCVQDRCEVLRGEVASPSSDTVEHVAPEVTAFLSATLASAGLSAYKERALRWCSAFWRAVGVNDVMDNSQDLMAALGLDSQDEARLAQALSEATTAGKETTYHTHGHREGDEEEAETEEKGDQGGSTLACIGKEALQIKVDLLAAWLKRMALESYVTEAIAWCHSEGAAEIHEVAENWKLFADGLGLSCSERERLKRGCQHMDDGATRCGLCEAEADTEGDGDGDHVTPVGGGGIQLEEFGRELDAFGPEHDPERYMVEGRPLGHGATAVVHKCERVSDSKPFAVKVLNIERLLKAMGQFNMNYSVALVNQEVQNMQKIQHPKIVQLHDVIETPRTSYASRSLLLVLDLCDGGELSQHIATTGSPPGFGLPENEARYIFAQLVDALQYLHSKNIVHRDLKPSNILIDRSASRPGLPEVKLSDFGLSKQIRDGYTKARSRCGTEEYWAPEQQDPRACGSDGYDERVDIWSLGIVLYEMLVGNPPFKKGEVVDESNLSFPRRASSSRAEEVVKGLLRKKPANRQTLAKCRASAWVSQSEYWNQAARRRTQGCSLAERKLWELRLPTVPKDVSTLKADLITYSWKHRLMAELQMLYVLVSVRVQIQEEALKVAEQELDALLTKHFPEWGMKLSKEHRTLSSTPLPPVVEEECVALRSMFQEDFQSVHRRQWLVRINDDATLWIRLPDGYPETQGPELSVDSLRHPPSALVLKELHRKWSPGSSEGCIYDCVCYLQEALHDLSIGSDNTDSPLAASPAARPGGGGGGLDECEDVEEVVENFEPAHIQTPVGRPEAQDRCRRHGRPPSDGKFAVEIESGPKMRTKKTGSCFQTHSARVNCQQQVTWVRTNLLQNSKIATATNNIIAYRFMDPETGEVVSEHDDDFDTGAGKALEKLLESKALQGVFVMVSRWLNGIEVGGAKFMPVTQLCQVVGRFLDSLWGCEVAHVDIKPSRGRRRAGTFQKNSARRRNRS